MVETIVAEKESNPEVEIEERPTQKKQEKKEYTTLGLSIWRLLTYFILYSILGYIIETVFGLFTKGVLESRQSFLYGPFCAIYGLGAVVMLVFLQYFKRNNVTLFVGGFLIGSIVEYVVSWVGEMLFQVKWWDYSSVPFNIQGRVCVFFSLFWGLLAIFLIKSVHPKVDTFINKHKAKLPIKTFASIGIMIMFLDCLVTGFALRMFYVRLVNNYDLKVQNVDQYIEAYTKMYENQTIKEITDKYFGDEKMLKTFPNLKMTAEDGSTIYVCDVLKDIKPYYFRLFTPKIYGQPIIEPATYEE